MSLDAVYVAYWSLREPLTLSQSLPVLRGLAEQGWRIALITYERDPWALPEEERRAEKKALAAAGIDWRPLTYHKRPALVSTAFDIVRGAARCAHLVRAEGARLLHGRGTVPSAVAWLASCVTRAPFFADADGPLSQEYVDAGVWAQGSMPHRLTAWVERRCARTADIVAVLSAARREELQPLARSEVTVLPCAVDTEWFVRDPALGERYRGELGLRGRVLVYAGKSGGWYRTDWMFDFVQAAARLWGEVSILVLTTDPPSAFLEPARERGLHCVVRHADRASMPGYLSAGDAGLSFRARLPSQRACSPIKLGEYLACGLPVVTTALAGDYPALVSDRRVGVVLEQPGEADNLRAAGQLAGLLSEPDARERCRAVAVESVDLREVVLPRYLRLYAELLGTPSRQDA